MKKVTGGGLPAKAWHDFMMAAHEGLSPSPLFGTTGVQPVFDEGVGAPAGDLLSGDPEAFPEAPVGVDGGVAVGQRPVDQGGAPWGGQTADQGNGGMVPPADVGQTTGATRRTTLFDILTGG